jgi:hypothetical protein
MKSSTIIIALLLLLCGAMYFLGKQNGSTQIKNSIVNNQQIVKQIAELAALEVDGSTTTTYSNAGNDNGFWNSIKNYLAENTLQITIPYKAKYGVDVSKAKIVINTNDTAVLLQFPAIQLLSFQLQLDKLQTMNQTGLFNRTTVADMKIAQQQMYSAAQSQLANNANYIQQATKHISAIFTDYYSPLGYKVICTFNIPN